LGRDEEQKLGQLDHVAVRATYDKGRLHPPGPLEAAQKLAPASQGRGWAVDAVSAGRAGQGHRGREVVP
jgi:hypothetical protein